MSASPVQQPTTPPLKTPMTLFAVLCGLTFAGVMYFQMSPRPTVGPVVFTYQQSSHSGGVSFDLPPGWKIVRNGHQSWHGGSVIDTSGRPRMEVWLHHAPNQTPPGGSQDMTFPWGKARCSIMRRDMERPFNSFHDTVEGGVVIRDFYLDDGFLSFRVAAKEDEVLKPMVRACMDSLRQQPGN